MLPAFLIIGGALTAIGAAFLPAAKTESDDEEIVVFKRKRTEPKPEPKTPKADAKTDASEE